MWHSKDICLSQWSVCRSSNYIFSVQKYAWIWYQKNTTHSYSSFCPPARRAENLNGCVSHVYSKFSADECRVRVSVCVVLYTQKKKYVTSEIPTCKPEIHYRKSVVCCVSDSSPCAFYRTHGKEAFCHVSQRKHTAKKAHGKFMLCHVSFFGTQQIHDFAMCFPLAHSKVMSLPCAFS